MKFCDNRVVYKKLSVIRNTFCFFEHTYRGSSLVRKDASQQLVNGIYRVISFFALCHGSGKGFWSEHLVDEVL
ncbi:hypothetical protein MT325_m161L [Paramecium bursaria chlorella virus MT325]|uniref:Uncharacterized protein m161L n=1 Tax=Paramecium bursaria Chlorella virus MT325 TaxID=346932 RepID=A7ITP1_PBCVM|nr:hypothetical protein MT325_m161L [Paramecium bursaria chlorella virus MT325]